MHACRSTLEDPTDVEFREAREHDMAVIAALLGAQRSWDRNPLNECNGGPFPAPDENCASHTGYPPDFFGANAQSIAYHREYFRYMVARYAAFVDVWELFNEYDEADEIDDPPAHGLTPAWKAAMANLVRSSNPYRGLVATTRTRNASSVSDAWQDLHVAHCYSYSSAADMCLHGCLADPTICARGVDALLATVPRHAGKPDLVDEFGFTHDVANDDPDHHRIGLWTALHLDTGILFWDANTRLDCQSPLTCPVPTTSSAYLSDVARSYFLGRQRYAALLPHTMKVAAVQPAISPTRLRVFALEDPLAGMYSAYVHRFDDHDAVTSAGRITIGGLVNERHEGVWIDTRTGVAHSSFLFDGTTLTATFPPFVQDSALLVRPASPVEILTMSLPEPVERAPSYFMLEARGGARPYAWRIVSGALPDGMVLDSGSGCICGTPRYGGSNRFTVEVSARPLATGGASSTDRMPLVIRWQRTFASIAGQDGVVIESARGSGVGGNAYDALETQFGLGAGDHLANERVVTLLSFDTSSIPDEAVIDSAKVLLACNDAIRSDPLPLGPLRMDVTRGIFGPSANLEPVDFQAPATAVMSATNPLFAHLGDLPPWPWIVSMDLDAAGRAAVNTRGFTQCRVYMDVPTDGDGVTDTLCFCPGGYSNASLRPKLVVTYH